MLASRNYLRSSSVAKLGRLIKINVTSQQRFASSLTNKSLQLVQQLPSNTLSFQNDFKRDLPVVELLHQFNGLKLKDDKSEPKPAQDPINEENNDQRKDEDPETTPEEKPVERKRRKSSQKIQKSSTESSSAAKRGTSSSGNNDDDGNNRKRDDDDDDIPSEKAHVPDFYPQVLALPMSHRPLFPGFYRPVAITDPEVIKAIHELSDKSKPYIGIFLFKDDNASSDVILDKDEVHEIGVFAQITSSFISKDEATGKETMTIITYPHGRVRIDDLIPPKAESETEAFDPEKSKQIEKEVDEELSQEGKDLTAESVQDERAERIIKKIDDLNSYNPVDFLKKYQVARANITKLEDEQYDRKSAVINALTSEILKVFKEISQINSMFREQIATLSSGIQSSNNIFDNPASLADFCAAVCAADSQELQDVLNSLNIEDRLKSALVVLKKEIMTAELQSKIAKDVENKIQKRQREYYLMEQMKGIKKELGIDDGRQKLIEQFNERVEKLRLPAAVQKVFDEEIAKLSTLETAMSEFSVTRNYLDWLTQLPWGKYTQETFNIANARKILDEDHYGLKDIKDRILEFIAVGSLLGAVDGKIICFVGPPGVGKTSIGKSIARALNRNFFRFSVGGISDVSEIKGHRRTYIGALPGRIIQGLKKTESLNPLFLIDEIDKVTHGGSQGDPSAALLELLDPEQNNEFLDQYLDIPVDLSKVLFVCTANSLDTIPRPLLDRMEIIELPGYVAEEKVKIAENYLVPLAKKSSGLEDTNINLTTDGIEAIVKHYAKENGVRRLKQFVEKVYRKAAFKVVTEVAIEKDSEPETQSEAELKEVKPESENDVSEEYANKSEQAERAEESNETKASSDIIPNLEHNKPLETKEAVPEDQVAVKRFHIPKEFKLDITAENLKEFVGPKVYTSDRLYETTPPGVIMGLAWTSIGGTSMYVEATAEEAKNESGHPSGGRINITGQLGDVMKESSAIAFSVAKQYIKSDFFKSHNINLHCPEGATPKDGPSAGITITTGLISLALNTPLPSIAMTGEITLTGKVLRIGGLKEKLIAAKRNGVTTLFLPKDNQGDYDDLPENLKEGFDVTFAENYSQIFDKLFKGIPNEPTPKIIKPESISEKN